MIGVPARPVLRHRNAPDRFANPPNPRRDREGILAPRLPVANPDNMRGFASFADAKPKVGFTGVVDLSTAEPKLYINPVVGDPKRGTVDYSGAVSIGSFDHQPKLKRSGHTQLCEALGLNPAKCVGFGLTKGTDTHDIEFQSITCHKDKFPEQGRGRSSLGGPNAYCSEDWAMKIMEGLAPVLGANLSSENMPKMEAQKPPPAAAAASTPAPAAAAAPAASTKGTT